MAISPLFVPVAQAGTFSFIDSLFAKVIPTTEAQVLSLNSQTVPLLAAAVNLDPNPAVGGDDFDLNSDGSISAKDGPSGTVAEINQTPGSISVYTVHDGDTLSGVAQMFGIDSKTILGANDIPGGIIHPGETLLILPIAGINHTVVAGDTFASLAKKYGSNEQDIAHYNGLDDSAPLVVGATLLIPGGELTVVSAPSSPKKTATNISEPILGGGGPPIPGYFAWPTDVHILTQGLHGWNAVDIGAPRGAPIHAAAEGTVIVAKSNGAWNGGYGNYVVIQHPNGTQTLYAHMSVVKTTVGAHVSQGDTIGLVGATGLATGPHLHFEVRGAANPFAN